MGESQQGPLDTPTPVGSYGQFITLFGSSTAGLANPYLAPSVAAFFANGGQVAWIVRTADATDASLIGVDGGPGARTGLQSLMDVFGIGTVAIPGATSQVVQNAMIAHCEAMGDRVALLDPVSQTDPAAVITQRSGLASADGFAALYFPWVVAAPTGVSQTLPPSGFVAGIYARTSPPDSPAGPTNGIVTTATDVSYAVTTTDQNTLNPLGIEAIRWFSGQGVLLFGARTLASNTDWQYVAVRRMGIALQQSIDYGTQWALSETNDQTLWDQLRSDVEDFMAARFQEGWFQGVSANDAYFVRCDVTTMTATDIAEGRTIILVGFAPLTPAEFIVFQIVQQRTGSVGVAPLHASFALNAPHPNPTASGAMLSFQLPERMEVSLRIFDVAGRVVRTLAAGEPMAAGPHERVWDGLDEGGTTAAPGMYVVRLQAGGRTLARRLVRVH